MKYIGFVCFTDQPDHKLEIAYIIHYKCQGQGYGNEMIDAIRHILLPNLVAYCIFANMPTPKEITATALVNNIPSHNMLRRAGFRQQEGEIYKHNGSRYSFFYPIESLKDRTEEKTLALKSKL